MTLSKIDSEPVHVTLLWITFNDVVVWYVRQKVDQEATFPPRLADVPEPQSEERGALEEIVLKNDPLLLQKYLEANPQTDVNVENEVLWNRFSIEDNIFFVEHRTERHLCDWYV